MEIDPLLQQRSGETDPGHTTNNTDGQTQQSTTMSPSGMPDYPDPPSNRQQSQYYPEPPSQVSPTQHNQPHYPDPPSHSDAAASSRPLYYAPSSQAYTGVPASGASQSVFSTDPNYPFAEVKRPRACEACRQLKVRCEPNEGQDSDDATCKRCAKAGRTCVVTMPARKRQKKTDSRVAELERKIDALTANMHPPRAAVLPDGLPNLKGEQHMSAGRGGFVPQQQQHVQRTPSVDSPTSLAGNKRRNDGEVKASPAAPGEFMLSMYARRDSSSAVQMDESPSSARWPNSSYAPNPAAQPERSERSQGFSDPIDRGIVDVETASKAFERYVNEMAPLLPAVVFPPETQMGDVRKTKPAVFHAILATSIGPIKPSVQLGLFNDLYKMLANRILVRSEKVLELVQALIITYLWYDPPEHFEELKFYQLSHMAVVLGMELGMSRRTMNSRRPFSLVGEVVGKKPPSFNPDSPETRRTWLSCYFMSVMSSVALRRVLLLRWQPFLDESLEILEKSPHSLPSDKRLVVWIKFCRMMEEVGSRFVTDSPYSSVSMSDPNVLYTVQLFEKELNGWKEVSSEASHPFLRQFEHILNIHIHEVAMHVDSENDTSDPENEGSRPRPLPLSAAQINSLTICLSSIHQALDATISINPSELLAIPTIGLARTAYSAVSLIKLYSFISSPESGDGHVLDLDSLKVDYYLDTIVEHYRVAGELSGGRTAARFSVVLAMLRSWFSKRREQLSLAANGEDGAQRSRKDSKQVNAGQTPLHLLSEVAMGEPNKNRNENQQGSQPQVASTAPAASSSSDVPDAAQGQGRQPWMLSVPNTDSSATPTTFYPPPFNQQQNHQHQHQHQQEQSQDQLHEFSTYPNSTGTGAGAGDNILIPSSPVPPPAPDTSLPSALQSAGLIPDLGMQSTFIPDNLVAMGSMVDDGFFDYGFLPGLGSNVGMGFNGSGSGNANGGSYMGFWS